MKKILLLSLVLLFFLALPASANNALEGKALTGGTFTNEPLSSEEMLYKTAPAQQFFEDQSGDFSLARYITLKIPSKLLEERQRLTELIKASGGDVETNFFRKFSAPKISISQRSKIEGSRGEDALEITVSQQRINIYYTSTSSLTRAIELLESLVVEQNSRTLIAGGRMVDWGHGEGARVMRNMAVIDLTQLQKMDTQTLLATASGKGSKGGKTNRRTVNYRVVSPTAWVIESPALEDCNPTCKPYDSGAFYSLQELKALQDRASSNGLQVVLEVDLMDSNATFSHATGFEFNSVEGMRFVRELLGVWSKATGITHFNIKLGEFSSDSRYTEFIALMQTRLGITITRS